MKIRLLMAVMFMGCLSGKGQAQYDVIDRSALQEQIQQTLFQCESLQTQISQYQRMLMDAMNPGSFNWGSLQGVLSQLQGNLFNINSTCQSDGGINSALDKFDTIQDYDKQAAAFGTNSHELFEGQYQGSVMQKQSADALMKLIEKQQKDLEDYSQSLDDLKSKSANAQGQQEAIQAGNEIATKEIELLAMIHALLLEQNQMLGAVVETKVDQEAREKKAHAIFWGSDSRAKHTRNSQYRWGPR